MIWKYEIFARADELLDFLNSLGNGVDFEAKIVWRADRASWFVFYPVKE